MAAYAARRGGGQVVVGDQAARLVLIIDQLEEIFTLEATEERDSEER